MRAEGPAGDLMPMMTKEREDPSNDPWVSGWWNWVAGAAVGGGGAAQDQAWGGKSISGQWTSGCRGLWTYSYSRGVSM